MLVTKRLAPDSNRSSAAASRLPGNTYQFCGGFLCLRCAFDVRSHVVGTSAHAARPHSSWSAGVTVTLLGFLLSLSLQIKGATSAHDLNYFLLHLSGPFFLRWVGDNGRQTTGLQPLSRLRAFALLCYWEVAGWNITAPCAGKRSGSAELPANGLLWRRSRPRCFEFTYSGGRTMSRPCFLSSKHELPGPEF